MKAIHRHYDSLSEELTPPSGGVTLPSRIHGVVLVSRLHTPAMRALAFARATRPTTLTALTVQTSPEATAALLKEWGDRQIPVPLKVLDSPYREVTGPVLDYIRTMRRESPRDVICVFVPEYVVGHWWEQLLHNQSALRLKTRLLFLPGRDGDQRALADRLGGGPRSAPQRRTARRLTGCETGRMVHMPGSTVAVRRGALPAAGGGLSPTRRWAGLGLALAGLPALTAGLVALRAQLSLESVLLLYTLAVVMVAVVGGVGPAVVAATVSFLLANRFLTPPYGEFAIADRFDVIALVVFVLVAVTVSVIVDLAARSRVAAARSMMEAELLSPASPPRRSTTPRSPRCSSRSARPSG